MADPRQMNSELESVMRAVGRDFEYPPTPQTSHAVRARILENRRPARGFAALNPSGLRIPAIAGAAALLAVLAAATIPPVRSGVAHFFHVQGVVVTRTSSPLPSLSPLPPSLGRRVTLEQARAAVSFRIGIPASLGQPDAVFLDDRVPGGEVTLLYRPRAGIPEAPTTGAGVLVSEFRGDVNPEYLHKDLGPATTLEETAVNRLPAYWFAGPPHMLLLADRNGDPRVAQVRLAGNTLVWARATVTYRIESLLSKAGALGIASTIP